MLQNSNTESAQDTFSSNQNLQISAPEIYVEDNSPLSIGDYLIMYLVLLIPIANIIMPFVWAFGKYNVNKKNLAKAMIIFFLIIAVISTTLLMIFGNLVVHTLKSAAF